MLVFHYFTFVDERVKFRKFIFFNIYIFRIICVERIYESMLIEYNCTNMEIFIQFLKLVTTYEYIYLVWNTITKIRNFILIKIKILM